MRKNTLNVAVVGIGSMSQTIHLPMIKSISDRLNLEIIVDPHLDSGELDRLSKLYNCNWTRNILDVNSDLIVIVTPVSTHFDIAKQFIKNKKAILIEKPITHTTDYLTQLIMLKKETIDCRIYCGHMRRFYRNNKLSRKVIQSGLLGNIKEVKIFEGNLYGWARKFYSGDKDLEKKKIDEGVLFDVGSHSIDSFAYIFSDILEEVEVISSTMDESELMSNIDFKGKAKLRNQPEEISYSGSFSNTTTLANMIIVKGENATLLIPPSDSITPKLKTNSSNDLIELDINNLSINPFYQMYDEIIRSNIENIKSVLDIESFYFTTKILNEAYKKAKIGNIDWLI